MHFRGAAPARSGTSVGRDYTSLWAVGGFPGGSAVKNLPTLQETQETQVRSRAQGDPLEEGMTTRPSILTWKMLWTEEPGTLQPTGRRELAITEETELRRERRGKEVRDFR